MKWAYVLILLVAFAMTIGLRGIIIELTYDSYKDTLGALLNISSIIFAIVGAWIAIIYPKAIDMVFDAKSVSDPQIKDANKDADYLSELLEIVVVSALVLMAVLTIQFSAPIIKKLPVIEDVRIIRYLAFYLIAVMTLMQLVAVFRVVMANYLYLAKLRTKNREERLKALISPKKLTP